MGIFPIPKNVILDSQNLLKLWKQRRFEVLQKCEDKVDQHVNTFEVGSKKYKTLIIKMATNNGSMETTKANFVNLCDVGTILSLSCVLLMPVSWAQKLQIHMFKK
jgi:hypothetical protein